MFKFKILHNRETHMILVRKDMDTREFIDALCFTLDLQDDQIVGFKDSTGKNSD